MLLVRTGNVDAVSCSNDILKSSYGMEIAFHVAQQCMEAVCIVGSMKFNHGGLQALLGSWLVVK